MSQSIILFAFLFSMVAKSQPIQTERGLEVLCSLVDCNEEGGSVDWGAIVSAVTEAREGDVFSKHFAEALLRSTARENQLPPMVDRVLKSLIEQISLATSEHLFLEEVTGEQALSWVDQENQKTESNLTTDPRYEEIYSRDLSLRQSEDRLAHVSFFGKDRFINFWTDKDNPRGLIRATTREDYLKNENPTWDVLLDIDALGRSENKDFVFKGATRDPGDQRALIFLSDGGEDASEVREFDYQTRTFVKGGFHLPKDKSRVSWLDRDTLAVGTSQGGGSTTTSGYPASIRLWKRGSPIESAQLIYQGEETDVSVSAYPIRHKQSTDLMIVRSKTFFESEYLVFREGNLVKLDLPSKAEVKPIDTDKSNHSENQLLIRLNEDWMGFSSGSLVVTKYGEHGLIEGSTRLLRQPTESESIVDFRVLKDFILVATLEDVKSRVYRYQISEDSITHERLPFPEDASLELGAANPEGNDIFVDGTGFTTPTTIYRYDANQNQIAPVKGLPANFDPNRYVVEQFFATSDDGAQVPYFVISPKNTAGEAPTLLYGYGGFQISLQPFYLNTVESAWLRYGGRYVIANIRGGGEYGPAWHQAALKQSRHKAFQDFAAVGEDLISKGYTTPKKLGIQGGSNGGLLTGALLTMRPDLINAALIQVPLLDMLRFHLLLAGDSWTGEYGDPRNEYERHYLSLISPYHNVNPEASYPKPFFMTSTKDDRVHPGHARKMAFLMGQYGFDFYYYEDRIGGHGSADAENRAKSSALGWMYLIQQLFHEH